MGLVSSAGAERSRQRAGFTLIELLVVIFVMGLIASGLMLTLNPGSNRTLIHEADRLALTLREASALARASGLNYQWRYGASGYSLTRLPFAQVGGDFDLPPSVQEFQLANDIRIARVQANDETNASAIIIPAHGVAGAATITLVSSDQEIDISSEGMSRYVLSTPRQRSHDAGS